MLWNTFEKDLENLDRYHNPNFEAGSGITNMIAELLNYFNQ